MFLDDVVKKVQQLMADIDDCRCLGRKNNKLLRKIGLAAVADDLREKLKKLKFNSVKQVAQRLLGPLAD